MAIVYKLTSPSGKVYIGQTGYKLCIRLAQHSHAAKKGIQSKIARALRKYSLDKWSKQILFEGTAEECWLKEIEYISLNDSIKSGYNISTGGKSGATGRVVSTQE